MRLSIIGPPMLCQRSCRHGNPDRKVGFRPFADKSVWKRTLRPPPRERRHGGSILPKTGSLLIAVRQKRRRTILRGLLLFAAVAEALLIYLGRSHGSTARERARSLPGDRIVAEPDVVTNHAISIGVPPESVWPWLTQMGWHRAGWYTARRSRWMTKPWWFTLFGWLIVVPAHFVMSRDMLHGV